MAMLPIQTAGTTPFLLLVLSIITESKLVTFSNTVPRRDSSGAVIKGHDGTTQRFHGKGPFYYHAMGYPPCNQTGTINGCSYKNGQDMHLQQAELTPGLLEPGLIEWLLAAYRDRLPWLEWISHMHLLSLPGCL